MTKKIDVIIVGSGPGAVHCAWPLAIAGYNVLMLDVGLDEEHYHQLVPNLDFYEIRRAVSYQHRFFLGKEFEGIPSDSSQVGIQLTPPRLYITKKIQEASPVITQGFSFLESFAKGGLGASWGAACYPFNDQDLKEFPISFADLKPHYEKINSLIGVCGEEENLSHLQPPPMLDANASLIFQKYFRKEKKMNRQGFYLRRPWLAMNTRPLGNRQGCQYLDMEFWGNADQSVYRPAFTLDTLCQMKNFDYRPNTFVTSFKEGEKGVVVYAKDTKDKEHISFFGKKLCLGAGTFGTTRIVLRSLEAYETKVPFLCNDCSYSAMIHWPRLGKINTEDRYSLAQLVLSYEEKDQTPLTAQLYSYRSLLQFKLVHEVPLPSVNAYKIIHALQSSLMILGLFYEDRPHSQKYCFLKRHNENEDQMIIYNLANPEELTNHRRLAKQIIKVCRQLGLYTLKTKTPEYGSSIHYGGTLPMTNIEKPLTVNNNCQLRGTRHVYLVDGSVFPTLPAKGPTYTIMANANRVGTQLTTQLKEGM